MPTNDNGDSLFYDDTPWPDPRERKRIVDEARKTTRQRIENLGELPSKNAPRYIPKSERGNDDT